MSDINIEKAIEALIFSSDKPLPITKIKEALGTTDLETIKGTLANLRNYYAAQDRSFELQEIAGGYQFVTKPDYCLWISKLYKKQQDKIRGASMETLAIIVYKQPITKAEIESVRGVNVDGVLKTLLEKNLIKIKGRREAPGRPLLYGTTDEFLMRFGLKDLNSLPPLKEFTEQDLDFTREGEDIPEQLRPRPAGPSATSEDTDQASGMPSQEPSAEGSGSDNAPGQPALSPDAPAALDGEKEEAA
ncbi:MAG: SMC-Scp complex subunit ScpB [Candidatus Omnitrophica bacterium]|nr:SMC-Scp complex subunit ScpB [Candidatus Omnitrophota bacterium]